MYIVKRDKYITSKYNRKNIKDLLRTHADTDIQVKCPDILDPGIK